MLDVNINDESYFQNVNPESEEYIELINARNRLTIGWYGRFSSQPLTIEQAAALMDGMTDEYVLDRDPVETNRLFQKARSVAEALGA